VKAVGLFNDFSWRRLTVMPGSADTGFSFVEGQKAKSRFHREVEAAEAWASIEHSDQCTNRAIRMMIGIGTPRKNRSRERMVNLLA